MSNLVYSIVCLYIIVTKRPLLKRVIISWPCMARRGTARVSHWHRFQKSYIQCGEILSEVVVLFQISIQLYTLEPQIDVH